MRRFLTLLFVAVVTFGVVLYLSKPEIFEGIWIWVVGLAGSILQGVRVLWDRLTGSKTAEEARKKAAEKTELEQFRAMAAGQPLISGARPGTPEPIRPVRISTPIANAQPVANSRPSIPLNQPVLIANPSVAAEKEPLTEFHANPNTSPFPASVAAPPPLATEPANREPYDYLSSPPQLIDYDANFPGLTASIHRYHDDGKTTIGFLYLNGKFASYTLEDTFMENAGGSRFKQNKSRIPSGKYNMAFAPSQGQFSKKYRRKYSEWFNEHLEIQNVSGFQDVIIHIGGNHADAKGTILVVEDLNGGTKKMVRESSERAFARIYPQIAGYLELGKPVQIILRDEKWFQEKYA